MDRIAEEPQKFVNMVKQSIQAGMSRESRKRQRKQTEPMRRPDDAMDGYNNIMRRDQDGSIIQHKKIKVKTECNRPQGCKEQVTKCNRPQGCQEQVTECNRPQGCKEQVTECNRPQGCKEQVTIKMEKKPEVTVKTEYKRPRGCVTVKTEPVDDMAVKTEPIE